MREDPSDAQKIAGLTCTDEVTGFADGLRLQGRLDPGAVAALALRRAEILREAERKKGVRR